MGNSAPPAELAEQDRAQALARNSAGEKKPAGPPTDQVIRHYLYFRERDNAERAAKWFSSQGFSVETKPSGDGENWLTLVKHGYLENADDIDKIREEMEATASQLNGEYDGWEAAVSPIHD